MSRTKKHTNLKIIFIFCLFFSYFAPHCLRREPCQVSASTALGECSYPNQNAIDAIVSQVSTNSPNISIAFNQISYLILYSIDSNLWKLYFLRGLAFAWFPIPTILLFYQSHGLNLEQTVLLKTIFSLSVLVLEVPSGYVADRLGRKFCLVAGSGVWIIGWLFYCFGDSFAIFAMAEILSGIAASLISGADTAIAYETLLQLNRESYCSCLVSVSVKVRLTVLSTPFSLTTVGQLKQMSLPTVDSVHQTTDSKDTVLGA